VRFKKTRSSRSSITSISKGRARTRRSSPRYGGNEKRKDKRTEAEPQRGETARRKLAARERIPGRKCDSGTWKSSLTVAHTAGAVGHADVSALTRSSTVTGRRLVAASPSRVSAIAPAHRPCRPSGPSAVHDCNKQQEGWRRRIETSFRSESPSHFRVARSKKRKGASTRQNGLVTRADLRALVGEHARQFAHVYRLLRHGVCLSFSFSHN